MRSGSISGGWARDALRRGTRDAHAALDATAAGLVLSDRRDLGAFLTAMAAATAPVEAAIARATMPGAPAALLDLAARRRWPALAADLAGLGLDPPPPVAMGPLRGASAALGALYVLEGARLGGRALAPALASSADPAVRAATRFLADPRSPALWRGFLAHLDAQTPQSLDIDAAVAGALTAFDAFLNAASRYLPPAATPHPSSSAMETS